MQPSARGMLLVDQALGHGGGGKRQVVALDQLAQQRRIADAHRRGADDGDRPLRRLDQLARPPDDGVGRGGDFAGAAAVAGSGSLVGASATSSGRSRWTGPRGSLSARRMACVTVSPIRPASSAQRGLGDRLEQRVVIDPHLHAPAELVGVEVAGDRDHRRAVEPGIADAGGEIGGPRAERGDAQPGHSGHPAGDVGGETRPSLHGR